MVSDGSSAPSVGETVSPKGESLVEEDSHQGPLHALETPPADAAERNFNWLSEYEMERLRNIESALAPPPQPQSQT